MNQEYKEAVEKKRKAIKILEDSNFNSTIDYFFQNGFKINRALENKKFIQLNSKLNIKFDVDEYLLMHDWFNIKIGENLIRFFIMGEPPNEHLWLYINDETIFECDLVLSDGKKQLKFHEDFIKKIIIDKKIIQIMKNFEAICKKAVLFYPKVEEEKEKEKKEEKIKEINSNISLGDLDD